MSCRIAARHLVWPRCDCGLHTADIVGRHAVWEPGLERGDTGKFPAADRQFGYPTGARCNLLTAANGKVVNEAREEELVEVEIRWSVIEIRIVVVHEALEAGAAGAHSGGRRL